MIDPTSDNDLPKRVEALEQENAKRIKAEKLLLELSQYHKYNVEEVLARTGRIELNQGTANERFDTMERKLDQILDLLNKIARKSP